VNLANDKAAKGVVPDYEKPVSEVYREVAVSHICNMLDPLQIFESCGTPFSNQDIQPRFASWIPRWEYLLPEMELPKYTTLDDGTKSRLYDVCGPGQSSHSGFGDHSQSIEFHGLALHVRGSAIDTLTSRSTSCLELEIDEKSSEVSGWVPPDAAAPYLTEQGQTRMEAFLRTLVADTTLETPPRRGGQAVWSNDDNSLLRDMDDNNRGWVTDIVGMRAFAISEKGYFALVTGKQRLETSSLCFSEARYCTFCGRVETSIFSFQSAMSMASWMGKRWRF
jgi:hypothetical protein